MKLKATKTFISDFGTYAEGKEFTVDDADGKYLISKGVAEEIKEPVVDAPVAVPSQPSVAPQEFVPATTEPSAAVTTDTTTEPTTSGQ